MARYHSCVSWSQLIRLLHLLVLHTTLGPFILCCTSYLDIQFSPQSVNALSLNAPIVVLTERFGISPRSQRLFCCLQGKQTLSFIVLVIPQEMLQNCSHITQCFELVAPAFCIKLLIHWFGHRNLLYVVTLPTRK